MRRLTLLLTILWFFSNNIFSQTTEDFCIGKRLSIKSEILEKTENVQLFLPNDFNNENKKKYPVLFVLDGDNYFHAISGVVNQLAIANKIPETIVVGINPDRKYCFDKGLLIKYLDFVEKELRPFIADNYNSIPYNILVANSVYGQMGLYSLINKSNFFQTVIMSSAFFTFPDYSQDFEFFIDNQKKLQNNFFISCGFEEENKIDKIYRLARKLHITPVDGLDWSYKQFENEDREMVLLLSVMEYLPQIFSDIQMPPFASYNDYRKVFDKKEILFEKYKYDFLGLTECPMSISRAILEMVLEGKAFDEKVIVELKESPYYFADDIEMYNLSSYLTSIGENKAAKQVNKLIEGKVDMEFVNNYSENINLTRGLLMDLPLDSANINNIMTDGGVVEYAENTIGIDSIFISAVQLTDRNGRIRLNHDSRVDPRKSISFSCWLYPYKLKPPDSWAISLKEGNKGPHWNTTVGSQNKWGLEIYSVSRFLYLVQDTIPLHAWTNIVFVADQSIGRLTIYMNGERIYETNELVPFMNSTEILQLGNDILSFDGKLDEFKLYQRVLSAAEVKQIYFEK